MKRHMLFPVITSCCCFLLLMNNEEERNFNFAYIKQIQRRKKSFASSFTISRIINLKKRAKQMVRTFVRFFLTGFCTKKSFMPPSTPKHSIKCKLITFFISHRTSTYALDLHKCDDGD